MNMQFDRSKQTLLLEGREYSREDILIMSTELSEDTSSFLKELLLFLADWFDENSFMRVQTSGSTGTPKVLNVRKEQMMQSARLTCEFLSLHAGDTALLCMPLQYIAGKMMVVRSLYAGLDLEVREPSGHPLADWGDTPLRFAAMIPLQVYNTLRVPEERKRLEQTDILIIGGGAIDAALEQEIRQMPNTVYSTYGMTETLSHVALRRLNGPEASPYYHPFPSVTLSLSPDNTLVIDAPLVCDERLVTNDVARLLPDGSFAIIGRKDNIINSGGIKIQIEEVEERLRPYLDLPYAITAAPDPRLGEAVVLLIAPRSCETVSPPRVTPHMKAIMSDSAQLSCEVSTVALASLPKYLRPRHVIEASEIPQTGSGKIDRAACRELARNIITKTL